MIGAVTSRLSEAQRLSRQKRRGKEIRDLLVTARDHLPLTPETKEMAALRASLERATAAMLRKQRWTPEIKITPLLDDARKLERKFRNACQGAK